MKLYYVYILECNDGYLYTGITNNLSRRLLEHQQGLNTTCFTYKRRPVQLIFHQEFNSVDQAIYFEKKIKKWSREKKLALSNENFNLLQMLSECKNETHSRNKDLDSARPDIQDSFTFLKTKSVNQQVFLPELKEKNIELYIKREDTIHPEVSGNKFRKLKYNLQEAKNLKKTQVLTFGGAFSNHILATAAAGKMAGLKTIGIIRGEELGIDLSKTLNSNSTLKRASDHGMSLGFISRKQYRNKTDVKFLGDLQEKYGDFYLIPEGGTNELAVKGCEEILTNEDHQFDYICSCVGTGGTISGLINSSQSHQKVLGFPALKGDFLKEEIKPYVRSKKNWDLLSEYHFNGYGKYTKELIEFINQFKKETEIPLDPIYTGKMMYGILDMIKKDRFLPGSKILAIHTGGLQGIEGFNQRLQKKQGNLKIDS